RGGPAGRRRRPGRLAGPLGGGRARVVRGPRRAPPSLVAPPPPPACAARGPGRPPPDPRCPGSRGGGILTGGGTRAARFAYALVRSVGGGAGGLERRAAAGPGAPHVQPPARPPHVRG